MKKFIMALIIIVFGSFTAVSMAFATADTWTQKADFGGTVRYSTVSFSIGGKGYIGTGYGYTPQTGTQRTKDFWEYDPANDTWTQKADFGGAARTSAAGFSIGNKGYIGIGNIYTGGTTSQNVKDFWEYNPALNVWTRKADFGGGNRVGAVGFSIGNKGYIGWGINSLPTCLKDFWEYDPATDTWTRKADFGGTARSDVVAFSIGNKGYAGTGLYYNYSNSSSTYYKDFWEYDPAKDIWIQKADFGGAARYRAAGFSIGNKGYIGVGKNSSNQTDFWQYDPDTNAWTKKADFGGGSRVDPAVFVIGYKGYVGTGIAGLATYTKDLWEYEPTDVLIDNTPILIDFESPERDYNTLELEGVGLTYSEKGYTFTDVIGPEEQYPENTYFHYVGSQYKYPPCSVALVADSFYSTVTLTRGDGRPFSIAGIELNEMWGEENPPPTVLFTGKKVNGDIVTHSFTLDGKNQNGGEFFIFPQSFSNLVSVQVGYYQYPYSFDNLVVFASPAIEPDHQSIAYDIWAKMGGTCQLITTPDQFIFNYETDVDLNAVITSNTITVSGINAPAPISIIGGTYSINGGAYTSANGSVNSGDKVTARQKSSGNYLTTTVATLTIGGVSDTFSVTTKEASVITLNPVANRTVLWPPNNKMVAIIIQANASDSSGGPVTLKAAVSCNESASLGRDWTKPVINQKKGSIVLSLRATRNGNGTGRVYTINITATGTEGNSVTKAVTVSVPHDQRNKVRR